MEKSHKLKGAFHIHSNFSKDGKASVKEIAQKAKALQYDFLVLADHFEDIEAHKFNELIKECKRLGAHYGLSMIPGVEVCLENGAHVLVIGIKSVLKPFSINNLDSLRKEAKDQCALIGLAHLSHAPNLSLTELSKFDFIEGWNHRYNKGFPPLRTFKTAHVLQNNCFIGGLDMHSINELGPIWLETEENSVIEGIRNKKIITKNNFLAIDPTGSIKRGKAFFFAFFWLSISIQYVEKMMIKYVFLNKKPPKNLRKLTKIFFG